MSPQKRTLAALSGLLMTLLCVLGGSQAALAYDNDWHTPDGTRVTSTSESGQALRAALADRGALTNPGVSPTPEKTFSDNTYAQAINIVNTCPSGRFCTFQQQDNGLWRTYDFYRCADYRLSHWDSSRYSYNHQTDNAVVRLLGQNGNEVDSVGTGSHKTVDWDPVWTIRLCG